MPQDLFLTAVSRWIIRGKKFVVMKEKHFHRDQSMGNDSLLEPISVTTSTLASFFSTGGGHLLRLQRVNM